MAKQLKHFYDERVVRSIAGDLLAGAPTIRAASFVNASQWLGQTRAEAASLASRRARRRLRWARVESLAAR
jgi:hypothetical protein